jgi:predicted metal-binding membrane protein
MMVAMMLPVLVPMLGRYRKAISGTSQMRLAGLTATVSAGYFVVWVVIGAALSLAGASLAAIEMSQSPLASAVPIAAGVVVLIAGAVQMTTWKARQLECCREMPGRARVLAADTGTAWRHGLRLGLRCASSCANLMAILLVIGVMDVRAMVLVTTAILAERLD